MAKAQSVPAHAEGLSETLVSVQLRADVSQVGVLSLKMGATAPDILAVLLPGSPSVVRLVGTSLGTISSSFMALYGGQVYAGAIHTAGITEPLAKNSYRELHGFDYGKATIPQFLVHHKDDPCSLTSYAGALRITQTYKLPLIAVTGGAGFTGGVCQAHTQHGFKGREQAVMRFIAETMKTGRVASTEL